MERYAIVVTGRDWVADVKEAPAGEWIRFDDVEKFKALYNAMREELSNQYGDAETQMEVYERYPEWG